MRTLKIVSRDEFKAETKINENEFIIKIVCQITTSTKEINFLLKKGISEFENFKKNNSRTFVEKNKIWHVKQFLLEIQTNSKTNHAKLKYINELFCKEERRIKKVSDKLILNLRKQKLNKTIDDYNLETSYSVFTKNKKCNKKYSIENGNPFYIDNSYLLFRENIELNFYKDDWIEELNLKFDFKFCYTMHCLMYHSSLPLEDILNIDEIWIELKINYQFFIITS